MVYTYGEILMYIFYNYIIINTLIHGQFTGNNDRYFGERILSPRQSSDSMRNELRKNY